MILFTKYRQINRKQATKRNIERQKNPKRYDNHKFATGFTSVLIREIEKLRIFNRRLVEWFYFWIWSWRKTKVFYESYKKCLMIKIKQEKLFYSIQYKNGCLAASDLFHIFTQTIKFYRFYYHILRSTDAWKMGFIKQTVRINGSSFPQVLRQNLGWFLYQILVLLRKQ